VNAEVLKFGDRDPEKLKGLDLTGKVVLVPALDYAVIPAADRMAVALKARAFDKAVADSKALLEVVASKTSRHGPASSFLFAEDTRNAAPAVITVQSSELEEAVSTQTPMTISFDVPAPVDEKVTVKNVIGILPGSDPNLKSTCVLVTAHYDHIGTSETAVGMTEGQPSATDHIYNGANDDGSGTVSVVEIARALSALHPKRSIIFMTFFGEERGLLGSTYYGRHPVFPVAKTVADINLEQVGRTDSSEGPEVANASITGYDYSDVTKYLEAAGRRTGIRIYKDDNASDQFFVRSDNAALAEQGVPAHTLTTAFEYPDYHGLGDEWQKIDYDNMAKVDRTVALAVLNIANALKAPAWDASNPKTAQFREAQEKQVQR
jgi:Zn-dependent M28 family amino/carboxypeptidase